MNITGVILAAGTSSRMGPINKLLLKYKHHTVVEEVLEQLSEAQVDKIVVITGFERTRIEELLARHLSERIKCVHNGKYHLGRAESIKCAVKCIADDADAALFMVADKPGVTSALINRAIGRYRQDRPAILCVETPTGRGHPIIFARRLFADLQQLRGDCVGSELVRKYEDDLVMLKDETEQIDVDREIDYRRLLRQEAGKRTN